MKLWHGTSQTRSYSTDCLTGSPQWSAQWVGQYLLPHFIPTFQGHVKSCILQHHHACTYLHLAHDAYMLQETSASLLRR